MSLIYAEKVDLEKNKVQKIKIEKNPDNVLVRRVYTTVGAKRRITKLKEGCLIELPEDTGVLIMINGIITDYCDVKGTFIYHASQGTPNLLDHRFKQAWTASCTEFYDSIQKAKCKNDVRIYVIHTGLLSHIKFQINNPIAFQNTRYGILFVRVYGFLSIKILNPLKLLCLLLNQKDCETFTLDRITESVKDRFTAEISQGLTRLSLETQCTFQDMSKMHGRILEELKPTFGEWLENKWGIELLNVDVSTILPTAESREVMLGIDQKDIR